MTTSEKEDNSDETSSNDDSNEENSSSIKYYELSNIFDLDNDYLHPRETCTLIFDSADECIKAIKLLYPNATFNLSYNMAYYCGQVCNFDDHLWELKEYRDGLNK